MSQLNPSSKKMKKLINLSPDQVERKHIPQKKFLCYKRRSINLEQEFLHLQRIRRTNAAVWRFSSEEAKNGRDIAKLIGKVMGFDKTRTELALIFKFHFKMKNKDFFHLAQGLKGLKSLRKITLQVSRVTYLKLQSLMKGLTRLPSLETVSLKFQSFHQATDRNLNYISQNLKKFAFLKKIELDLDLSEATNKGLQKLYRSFNRFQKLKNLTQSIVCGQSPAMTHISLMTLQLKRLTFLQQVYFELQECSQLADEGLYFLTQDLKGLPNLQYIHLDFWKCPKFGDLGLHYIWEMMMTLPLLRGITLIFSDCSKITNAGFHDMNKTLKCLPLLERFILDFYRCSEVTNNGILEACQALRRFTSLQHLGFSFSGSNEITDDGVNQAFDCLNNLTHLRKVEFGLSECRKITDRSQNCILQYLKARPSLEKVFLCLGDNDGITEEETDVFNREIRSLEIQRPNLNVHYH